MKIKVIKFRVACDMGSIKIFSKDLSCFFSNGMGDTFATILVELFDKPKRKRINKAIFLGHFTCKDKAYLSDYDCGDNALYTFSKGRYFVYSIKGKAHIIIEKIDEELNS